MNTMKHIDSSNLYMIRTPSWSGGQNSVQCALGTSNVKGSWGNNADPVPFDSAGFYLVLSGYGTSLKVLLDLGFDTGSGVYQTIISNILTQTGSAGSNQSTCTCYLPVELKKGTLLSLRGQINTGGAENGVANIFVIRKGINYMPMYNNVITYGIAISTSSGTLVDPGASTGSYGAWSELTPAITNSINWLIIATGLRGNTAASNMVVVGELGVGSAGNEQTVFSCDYGWSSSVTELLTPQFFSVPCNIPAGSRLSYRAYSSVNDATDRLFEVACYGFY